MSNSPGSSAAAFFDVDGTLVDATIAHYLRYFMLRRLPRWRGRLWELSFLLRCVYYLLLDRIDRGKFNVVFYRNYRNLPAREIKAFAVDCERDVIAPRLIADAANCLATHRRNGFRIVLVSGSTDFILQPLANRLAVDHMEATKLCESTGCFTGEIDGPPIVTTEKAQRVRRYAREAGIDLSKSHAYGDSTADLKMLEAVGFPHAVNPDRKLRRVALARGWPIHDWSTAHTK